MTDTKSGTAQSRDSKHDTLPWDEDQVSALLELPFNDLIFKAHTIHRQHFDANEVQLSTLLSIKTGACPEDCAYCPQSAHYKTGIEADRLMAVDDIVTAAKNAKRDGATRFCMGAAWRNPKDHDLEEVVAAIKRVKMLGLETCATLGMLTADQARRLKKAGLDYYNHNLDTSAAFYSEIISTRSYDDRLQTLNFVRECGIRVCCGGIIGMGESRADRAALITTLANLPAYPESVPINMLVQIPGTPLHGAEKPDAFEFVRTIAVTRITMPKAYVRLSAGRDEMSDELQAWCFFAGANSIFSGDKLLTTGNATVAHDQSLFERLGIRPQTA
jgi:biotin synthase